jgi:hypothetical protein
VVFVEPSREVLRGRPDLDQVVRVPRPSERNRGLTEQRFDVHRLVRLARSALLLLLDEPDNGGVALGKRPLVGDARRSCRRDAKRGEGEKGHEPETSRCAQKSVPLMRRVWMRTDPIHHDRRRVGKLQQVEDPCGCVARLTVRLFYGAKRAALTPSGGNPTLPAWASVRSGRRCGRPARLLLLGEPEQERVQGRALLLAQRSEEVVVHLSGEHA